MSERLSDELIAKVNELKTHYPKEHVRAALIPSLWAVQHATGCISPSHQEHLAEIFGITPAQVRGTMEFYSMLIEKPNGKYHFAVCKCISCHIMGATNIIEYLGKKLGINPGEMTEDGKFSLEGVECLGACEGAPMMQINGINHMNLTPEKIDKILEKMK
jgi:NADH-quinone oxidoreductase subunit E